MDSIADMVRRIEEERDALAARCEAQERIMAQARALMQALDAYSEQYGQAESPTPTESPQPSIRQPKRNPRMGNRYTDDDVRRWRDALAQGTPIGELAQRESARPETILRRVKALKETAPELRPTSVRPGIFGDVQGLEAGELLRAGHSPEAVAAAFGVHVLQMRARLRNLEMDPDSGRFLNRPPEEDLLRERSSHASDDEEAA